MKNARIALLIASLFLLAACSSEAPKTSSDSKPAETKPAFQPTYLAGREALQKMYISARSWAADAKPYSLQSIALKEANGQDGKAGIWSAGFASASRRGMKVYTWSGVKAENAPEPGMSNNAEDTYNPSNTSTTVFDMAFLRSDSDVAFKAAEKHGIAPLLKKDQDTKIYYALNWRPHENKLVWRVLVGDQNDPKMTLDVDASTGTFIKAEK